MSSYVFFWFVEVIFKRSWEKDTILYNLKINDVWFNNMKEKEEDPQPLHH